MQQFLDKHSRSCWRRHPRCALFLRRATPMRSHFSGRTPPLLAPPSPLRLVSPSGHANTTGNFPGGRRLCWRRPPRCALFLRLATPTRSHFSRADAAFVGVPRPATPYSFVGPRQRGPTFPGRPPPLLASPYPLRLVSSSGHANAVPLFPGGRRLCWRPTPRYALFLRRVMPTRSHFSLRTPPLLASHYPLRLISSLRHANTVRKFPDMFAYWDTRKLKKRDSLQ